MSEKKAVGRKKAQPVAERYVYLRGDKALVKGAKYALVINFETGGLHQLNAPAC